MVRTSEAGHCRLTLRPDRAAARALDLILAAHARLLAWLDHAVPEGSPADLVALHRGFYEAARAVSRLPARSVTLGFRDWVRRRRGEAVEGLPLDEKLYSIKGIETVSIATLEGRVTMPFRVADYGDGWTDQAPARLVRRPDGFELMVATNAGTTATPVGKPPGEPLGKPLIQQEDIMSVTESALKRIGRVIAGMTNLAVDAAEEANPEAVIAQSIREIDAAADEVRAELGKATAERHRLNARWQQLQDETAVLDDRVKSALEGDRDDLAEAGIARQVDIEAQVGVLDRLLAETDEKIAQLSQTVDAVAASRREAEQTLRDYRASHAAVVGAEGYAASDRRGGAMNKVARAQAAVVRAAGVPASPQTDAKALAKLAELAREREVKARLARLKSERGT
jgi:phage shock protein A